VPVHLARRPLRSRFLRHYDTGFGIRSHALAGAPAAHAHLVVYSICLGARRSERPPAFSTKLPTAVHLKPSS
jgi:hypothetical protein